MTLRKSASVILAVAVASAFAMPSLAQGTATPHAANQIHCKAANSCKGKGMCKTSAHKCKGMNNCAGKSWAVANSKKECRDMQHEMAMKRTEMNKENQGKK